MPDAPPITTGATPTQYDLFISYSRKDNASGWVTALKDHIWQDHRKFSTAPLRIFFDTQEIKDADDWRHRILGALQSSKILLVCLSPDYFKSTCCEWEFREYVRRQVHQLMGSDSIAQVYFIEVPGAADEQKIARDWHEQLMRHNYTDVRPWFKEGPQALQREDVKARLAALGATLWERMQRARRAMSAPGNLRWQNPHFLGRTEELRLLHESLGLGRIGVVTAVQGLGGMGKTELAVAYAHSFADSYPAGLWSLGAEHAKELLPLIGKLAWERELGFTPSEAEKNDAALLGRGVLAHLKARSQTVAERDPDRGAACLILLDNVSEPDLLSPAQLATLPGGMGAGWLRIVATTRLDLKGQKDRLGLVAVDALDDDTALALLRDHQPPRDAAGRITDLEHGTPLFADAAQELAARQIVRALGGFTLAVEQVAVFLGLHPEVTPVAFLADLERLGLISIDRMVASDDEVKAALLHQTKLLGHILDQTQQRLSPPARYALHLATQLPPDCVPWPWLRELTMQKFAELAQPGDFGSDPWQSVQRQLTGLRLLTTSDEPEIARVHRLVAAHVGEHAKEVVPVLDAYLGQRADVVYRQQEAPQAWELAALMNGLPHRLQSSDQPHASLINDAIFVTEKLVIYRTLPDARGFAEQVHEQAQRLAQSDPANAAWQRDLSVSLNKLGDLAIAQGDLPAALRWHTECHGILQRLAQSDPANAAWQRDLSVSLNKLGDLAIAQGDLPAALRWHTECHGILQRLAQSDPANAGWQRDLSVSLNKLGGLAIAQGDLPAALRWFTEDLDIAQRLAQSDPANAGWQRDLSVSLEKLGDLAIAQGDLPAALRWHTECHGILQRLAQSDPANAGWQRDLSVSLNKLGDLAIAQGDLPAGLRWFTDAKAIAQRLAQSDPANAEWQRDLSVSHFKLYQFANKSGDEAMAGRELRACYEVLRGMKQRGLHFDPQLANLFAQLEHAFGT
ncbi:MAG: TIR domain-containing protein [Verrucomicrobiaceae bacterium]|nr:TIR domain-containing protein [Verrucomicrobiaceae bacterium]